MADEKVAARKKGLHGWRAAAAVFGCGSLAAFGVFGVVLAILGTLLSTTASGVGYLGESNDLSGSAEQGTSPREEFADDKFDLCRINISAISGVNLTLDGEISDPVDTSIEGGGSSEENLVRSGECFGRLIPAATTASPWEFEFSYRAIIFAPHGDRDEISGRELEQWRDSAQESISDLQDSGNVDFLDQAYYAYGASEDGGVEYVAVARKRSAILRFSMDSGDENSVVQFEHELRKFENHLDLALENLIPA